MRKRISIKNSKIWTDLDWKYAMARVEYNRRHPLQFVVTAERQAYKDHGVQLYEEWKKSLPYVKHINYVRHEKRSKRK